MSTAVNPTTVNTFMENHIPEIKSIIQAVTKAIPNKTFDSHDFIKKFSKKFEPEYINMVYEYKGNGAFKKVHAQIALFLSKHQNSLSIVIKPKVLSPNIFGNMCKNQSWEKIIKRRTGKK